MTEWEAGSDVASMTTTAAVPDGTGYRLNGGKTFISNAGIADFHVVFASTDPGRREQGGSPVSWSRRTRTASSSPGRW